MADPLRRTILAKLRGKKPKGKDASREREGKAKVSQTQTERGYISDEMRGEPSCVTGIRAPGLGCSAVAAAVRVHRSGGSESGGPAGEAVDRSEQTEPKRFHTVGDSIGFGNCDLNPKTEALKRADGQDIENKDANVTALEQKAGKNITERSPKLNSVFDYIDGSDLIRVLEEYRGAFSMPALQSPTFFPTDLELTAAPGRREGAPRHHSVDSEDDDYYDNQILPFYESCTQNNCDDRQTNTTEQAESTQETDRLKSQLKEAYYLLINTMHNISLDGQVEDNGFVDQASSSSRSHDSVSTQSTDKSDVCLSEERSGQQPFGSDSAFFTLVAQSCGVGSSQSRSLQNILKANTKPTLQRSVSDSRVKYSSTANTYEEASLSSVRMVRNDSANSSEDRKHQSVSDAMVPKQPGVTVNKMQEWMQKGRVLSSEMKQRIMGSSARANHSGRMRIGAGMDDADQPESHWRILWDVWVPLTGGGILLCFLTVAVLVVTSSAKFVITQ